jgi:hypothetical protein
LIKIEEVAEVDHEMHRTLLCWIGGRGAGEGMVVLNGVEEKRWCSGGRRGGRGWELGVIGEEIFLLEMIRGKGGEGAVVLEGLCGGRVREEWERDGGGRYQWHQCLQDTLRIESWERDFSLS